MIRVLLADDHAMVRRGLRLVLDAEEDLEVVAEAGDGAEAVARALADDVDLAILDVTMPRLTGIQAAAELSRRRPELKLLILSMHENEQYFYEALKAGASGYVLKSSADKDLVAACRAAIRNEPFVYPSALTALIRDFLERSESDRDFQGNTLRIQVTGKNAEGTDTASSIPTAVISAAPATTTTPTPTTPATGCPKTTQSSQAVAVADVSTPARLQIDQFKLAGAPITFGMQSFTLQIHVSSTCGNPVSGAKVYATGIPYNQITIPNEVTSGSDGWASLNFNRMAGFPVSPRQQLLAMFIRATKPGENALAGISTRRLVSLRVQHG